MLCLMWEYFQQSQNACSVSSALHQLAGTPLIRQGTEGIRLGGRRGGEGGGEGAGGEGEEGCLCQYLHSIIYLLSSDS